MNFFQALTLVTILSMILVGAILFFTLKLLEILIRAAMEDKDDQ